MKKFLMISEKRYSNKRYTQKIGEYIDIGENKPVNNTDVSYLYREIAEYSFYFSASGKTIVRCYYKKIKIDRISDKKTDYKTSESEEIDTKTAKSIYKRYKDQLISGNFSISHTSNNYIYLETGLYKFSDICDKNYIRNIDTINWTITF